MHPYYHDDTKHFASVLQ